MLIFPDLKTNRSLYEGDWGSSVIGRDLQGATYFEVEVEIAPTKRDEEGAVISERGSERYQRGRRNHTRVDRAVDIYQSTDLRNMKIGEQRQIGNGVKVTLWQK